MKICGIYSLGSVVCLSQPPLGPEQLPPQVCGPTAVVFVAVSHPFGFEMKNEVFYK